MLSNKSCVIDVEMLVFFEFKNVDEKYFYKKKRKKKYVHKSIKCTRVRTKKLKNGERENIKISCINRENSFIIYALLVFLVRCMKLFLLSTLYKYRQIENYFVLRTENKKVKKK